MYDFSEIDTAKILEGCKKRIKDILMARMKELEEMRDAINDRYPYSDLLVKWHEVDCEEDLIKKLLVHLEFSLTDYDNK